MKRLKLCTWIMLVTVFGNLTFAQRTNDLVRWGRDGRFFLDSDVKSIASNKLITIAIKEDGSLVGWGGVYGNNEIPLELNNVIVKKVSVGYEDAIALKDDSTIVVWSGDYLGGLTQNMPQDLFDIVDVSVGQSHALVLKSDGSVIAWGRNDNGESTVPLNLTEVKSISASDGYSVVLKEDGTVVAWGKNDYGQCNVPFGLTSVKAISAAYNHVVALKEDGTIVEWGNNNNVPLGLDGIIAVSASSFSTLALKEDGTVIAWGNGRVTTELTSGLTNIKSITAGEESGFAVKEDGTVVAWGENLFGQISPPIAVTDVKQVAQNYGQVIVLKKDGSLVIWGNNMDGSIEPDRELNDIKSISANSFYLAVLRGSGTVEIFGDEWGGVGVTNVPDNLTSVKAISAGDEHMLALKEDGTVVAWGYDYESGNISVPSGLTNVIAIAAGGSENSLALKEDGTVVAWGNDSFWENKFVGLTNVAAIAAGLEHFVILKEDGTVKVIAKPYIQEAMNPPLGLGNVIAIDAGWDHNLALNEDGTVTSWGSNNLYAAVPTGLNGVIAISAGWNNSIAILEGEKVSPVLWRNEKISCREKSFFQDIRASVDLPENTISMKFDIFYDSNVFNPKLKSLGSAVTEYGKVLLDKKEPGKLGVLVYLNQAPQGVSLISDELLFTIDWKLTNPTLNTPYEFTIDSIEVSYPIGYEMLKPPAPIVVISEKEYLIEIRTRNNKLMPYSSGNDELGELGTIETLIEGMESNCSGVISSTFPDDAGKVVITAEAVDFLKINRDVTGDQSMGYGCTNVNAVINSADVNRVIDIVKGKRIATPMELLSADVNLDGAVTLADASLISSRAINEYGCEFPQPQNYNIDGSPKDNYEPSRDWLFVAKSLSDQFTFDRMSIPLIEECQPAPDDCGDQPTKYLGILLGDVNGNWKPENGSMDDGLRTTATNQLFLDFIHTDTIEEGILIPVILDSWDFSFGIDMTIDMTNVPMNVKKIVPVAGISTRWSQNEKQILLQSFEYEGLPIGQAVFYIVVESIPESVSESLLNTSVSTFINGEQSTLRISSNTTTDNDNFEVTLYPNPVTNNLRIYWDGKLNEMVTIQLFDTRGKLIKTFDEDVKNDLWTNLRVEELESGSYLIHVLYSQGTINKTFVKL